MNTEPVGAREAADEVMEERESWRSSSDPGVDTEERREDEEL